MRLIIILHLALVSIALSQNSLKSVIIGNNSWMTNNLYVKSIKLNNCPDERKGNCQNLGNLFTYEQALKACPVGWHLPDSSDWVNLIKEISSDSLVFGNNDYNCQQCEVLPLIEVQYLTDNPLLNESKWFSKIDKGKNILNILPTGYSYGGQANDYGVSAYYWVASGLLDNAYRTYSIIIEQNSIKMIDYIGSGISMSIRCVK